MDSMNTTTINWKEVRKAIVGLPEKEYRVADEIHDYIKKSEELYIKRGFDTESVIARILNMKLGITMQGITHSLKLTSLAKGL